MKFRHFVFLTVTGAAASGTATAATQYFSYTGTRNSWTGSYWSASSGGAYTGAWSGYNEAVLEGAGGTVSGGGAVNKWTFNADGYILTDGFTMGSPGFANFVVGNVAHTATISGNLGRANDSNVLWKDGAGKLMLSGTNSPFKMVTEQGTLEISDGTTTVTNGFSVGRDSFGTALADEGTFKISGGSVTVDGGIFVMGQTVNGSTKVAQFTQTNGTFEFKGAEFYIANGGGVSQIDLSGGSFTSTTAGMNLGVRANATLNVSGTAAVNIPSIQLFWSNGVTGTGKNASINLDGGTLTTGQITNASGANTSVIHFNSGTLKARSSNASFLGGLTTANVKSGGAKIDTNNFNITIGQALLHDSGLGATLDGGLTKSNTGNLTLTGNNSYTGGTTISGGTLTVGHLNALGSGGVNVTGGELALGSFSVSNTITLNGGKLTSTTGHTGTVNVGGNAAITGTYATIDTGTNPSRVINTTGSLTVANLTGQGTFTGGMVTITGEHTPGNSPGTDTFESGLTYGNNNTVEMELAGSGGLAGTDFDKVNVTGTLTLDGNLDIVSYLGYNLATETAYNLFDASTIIGQFDTVSVGNTELTRNSATSWFGTEFGSGIGGHDTYYSFDESDGVLTVVPEPAAAVLGGLGLLALLRRRRA